MRHSSFTILLAVAFMAVSCLGAKKDEAGSPDDEFRFDRSKDAIVLQHEVRGVWLTTVGGYDWPSKNDEALTQRMKLQQMIKDIKNAGCNLVYFQVVSNMDAMYKSDILPWSHVITGTQGQDPGYDPLKVAVSECRLNGLEIHAWINPLRAGSVSMDRCADHVVLRHPEWIQTYGGNCFLDPGLPEVREHLGAIVTELMEGYDLDGVHIDDYFYPDGLKDDQGTWDDTEAFGKYGSGDLDQWRYGNIDECVKAMHYATHEAKPTAVFGVSPAGRLENTLKLYADPRRWVSQHTVDYLVPQIYWQHGHKVADFKRVLDSWQSIVMYVPMFTGLAVYRLGESGFESPSEFVRQVQECRDASYVYGHVWFRTVHMLGNSFLPTLRKDIYAYGSLVPKIGESDTPMPGRPSPVVDGTRITWEAVPGADGYAVYLLERDGAVSNKWTANLVSTGMGLSFKGNKQSNYAVLAYAGKEKSELSEVVYIPSDAK